MAELHHRARLTAAVTLVAALVAAGCTAPIRNDAAPRCNKTDTLVLLAQSVPSATLVPCIEAVPAGWWFGNMDIGTGDASFTLDSSEAGIDAVRVTLADRCRTAGATEVTSDEAETRQFERIESLVGEYRGTRSYVFTGGCVSYRFRLTGQVADLLQDASLALEFRTRQHVADELRRTSGGRLRL